VVHVRKTSNVLLFPKTTSLSTNEKNESQNLHSLYQPKPVELHVLIRPPPSIEEL